MEIEIFTLCDYAQDMNGKLTIIGTFDSLGALNFPCMHPHCSIAARLRFSEKELGKHRGVIAFKDSNGSFIVPELKFELDVKKSNLNGYTTVNLVLNLGNVQFKKPDKCSIELYLDDEWKSGLTLSLQNAKQAA